MNPMKSALIFTLIACALLVGGCTDTSLISDEDYARNKPPAPHSPDFTGVITQDPSRNPRY